MSTHKNKAVLISMLLGGTIVLMGCETTNGNNNGLTKGLLGAAAGAAAGAIIGNNAGDGDGQSGALIGAVIGGAGGAYAGCREDGGCGAQTQRQNSQYGYDYSRQQNAPYRPSENPSAHTQSINKRQYFDRNTGRYYYYDPVSRQEYYENGERKYR